MRRMVRPDGLKLHLLRVSKEMTMDDISKLSKISRISLRKIEEGREVSTLTAEKLANAYNIELFDYFTLIDNKK